MPYLAIDDNEWYCRTHGEHREGAVWVPLPADRERADAEARAAGRPVPPPLPDDQPLFCTDCGAYLRNPLSRSGIREFRTQVRSDSLTGSQIRAVREHNPNTGIERCTGCDEWFDYTTYGHSCDSCESIFCDACHCSCGDDDDDSDDEYDDRNENPYEFASDSLLPDSDPIWTPYKKEG